MDSWPWIVSMKRFAKAPDRLINPDWQVSHVPTERGWQYFNAEMDKMPEGTAKWSGQEADGHSVRRKIWCSWAEESSESSVQHKLERCNNPQIRQTLKLFKKQQMSMVHGVVHTETSSSGRAAGHLGGKGFWFCSGHSDTKDTKRRKQARVLPSQETPLLLGQKCNRRLTCFKEEVNLSIQSSGVTFLYKSCDSAYSIHWAIHVWWTIFFSWTVSGHFVLFSMVHTYSKHVCNVILSELIFFLKPQHDTKWTMAWTPRYTLNHGKGGQLQL